MRLPGLLACLTVGLCIPGLAAAEQKPEDLRPARSSLISHWFNLPFCDNDALALELPARYRVMHWRAVDFDLFSIKEAEPSRSGAELAVYIGHTPNERHPVWSSRTEGRVGGHRVHWYSWSEQREGKPVYWAETVVGFFPVKKSDPRPTLGKAPSPPPAPPLPPAFVCRDGISVHLVARGNSPEAAQIAAALASSLKRQ